MSSILTNNSAMVALQTLKGINKNMGQIQSEISTGKSVSSAKDNAAVWAISKVMESDVKGFMGISDSLSLGSSTISVARQASETVTDLLSEIKGKIVSAQEGNVDREKIQTDITALRDQIKSVTGAAQFNGLNMVKGTDDVSILSSLDRSGNGNVAASQITVNRMDLTSEAGKIGTTSETAAAYGTMTDAAGSAVTATTAAAGQNSTVTFLASTGVENFTMNINGKQVSYTTGGVETADDLAASFVGSINALGLEGVSAANTAGVITISNANAFEAMDVAVSSTVDASLEVTTANGVTLTALDNAGKVEQRAETIDFSATATPVGGDSFTVGIAGQSYSYVAGKGQTMEDVARGLKMAIDSAAPTGITTSVQYDEDNESWQLAVDDATGGRALGLTVTSGGEASGGLFGLDGIDVTTDEGAEAALSNIETMISKSVDAAASFGSAQNRIEIQSDFISKLSDTLKSGIGSMVDADMEETSARLQALQVQQQLGVQALSIANQSPQSILSLFR
jgi:flagellin